jgi:TM2 domain-containing membrane protein YozV
LFIQCAIWQIHLVLASDPLDHFAMPGQGSTGNVIAALCSFFIPGLGQLLQGRLLMAIVQFVLAAVMWIVLLGWLIHLWSILDAALYRPRV